jgi:hypothetical protein
MTQQALMNASGLAALLGDCSGGTEVVIAERNLLYKVKISEKDTAIGHVLVIERGDPVVW